MTFHDETPERPSLFDRLFASGDAGEARGVVHAARGSRSPTVHEAGRDGPLLWGLASFQLGLGALWVICARSPSPASSALDESWFGFWILVAHAISCVLWISVFRRRARTIASLERRAERAEESALAKSALLATMSHELRSPLNGIQGMSSLLSRTRLDVRQAEQVATLRSCADSLLVLVNDVLDFARLEVGKLPVVAAPFELRAAVDEVLAMSGPRAQEKGIELFAVVERGVAERVVGDMTRVRQALTNLVANAVKFTAHGEVEVRVSVRGAGRLRFSVSDTGIGIGPEARARLFKPFSQADGTISRDYGGSGLGLAICRRLVRAMGGTIDFESTLGIGSRFYFELPLPTDTERGSLLPGSSKIVETGPATRDQHNQQFDDPNTALARESRNPGCEVAIVIPHEGTREGVAEVCARLGLPIRAGANLSSLEAPFHAAIVDGSLPPSELEALAQHPHATRILLIARSTTRSPSWARSSLSWPVRQTGLSGALRGLAGQEEQDGVLDQHGGRFSAQTRILVVEDTAVNRIVAEALLSELGVSVQVARDGEEALAVLGESAFDLVMMDCQLPERHGFEVTRELRSSLGPNQRVPVVALTASAESESEQSCREAGMDDYLEKPIRRNELIRKLERWLPEHCRAEAARASRETPQRGSLPVTATPERAEDLVELAAFLHEFERLAGSSATDRLATTFRDSVPDTAHSLAQTACEREGALDRVALAKHAHALRGAARSMGLRALATQLAELERVSPSAESGLLETLTKDVEARMLRVRDALLGSRTEASASRTDRESENVANREAVG